MAATRTLKPVPDTDEDGSFHKEITSRGTVYRFVELDSDTYDECVEMARKDEDRIDTALLLKLLLPKSLVSPAMSGKEIGKLPMGVRRDLLTAVNDLHFPPSDLSAVADMLRLAGYEVKAPKAKDDEGKG